MPTGEHELYDTKTDPEEIHNLAATGADHRIESLLDRQLEGLRHCAGNAAAPPRPAPCNSSPPALPDTAEERTQPCCYDALPQVNRAPIV